MLLRVLIVEDEEINRRGLMFAIDWLSMDCIVVGAAKNGEEGLELIHREKPDVVLTDIKMPGMSGLQMIEEGLKTEVFASIVLTGYSEFELAKKALHIGVTDYLLKPVDEDELKETVGRIRERLQRSNRVEKIERISEGKVVSDDEDWRLFELGENNGDFYVRRTCEWMREHFSEKVSIGSAAEHLGVSPSFLSRRLKEKLNVTFVDLLNQYRVRQALRMLRQGNLRIYEISDRLGFSDYKYFSSVFKRYIGTSPTEFLRNGGGVVVVEKDGP